MYCSLLVLKRERRMEILAIISPPPPFFQFHRCFGLRVSTLRLLKNTLCHLVIIVIHKVFEFHLFPPGLLSVWFTFLFIFCFFLCNSSQFCISSHIFPYQGIYFAGFKWFELVVNVAVIPRVLALLCVPCGVSCILQNKVRGGSHGICDLLFLATQPYELYSWEFKNLLSGGHLAAYLRYCGRFMLQMSC